MVDSRMETGRWMVRLLLRADAAAYQSLRLEGFSRHPLQFRVAPEDEAGLSLQQVGERLAGTFVAGGFDADGLAGVAGLTRFEGAKSRHRALLWGMYVRERARGGGLADELIRALFAEARSQGIEQVILTLAADNERARRLYQRWGFSAYGIEPRAIKVSDGYLDEVLMSCRLTTTCPRARTEASTAWRSRASWSAPSSGSPGRWSLQRSSRRACGRSTAWGW
jgi:RimJ/RimL family protein N-acetyltransferase